MEHRRERSNSRLGKNLLTAGGIIAAAYIGYKILKSVKKEIKKEEQLEKESEKELVKEIGLTNDEVSEFVEDPDNVVKTLYDCIKRSPNWDLDVIDTDKALESEKTIHVRRFNGNNGDFLELMFEIPKKNIGSTIPSYINSFNRLCKELENISGNRLEIRNGFLRGYFESIYNFIGESELQQEFIEIDRELYSKYASGKSKDGLTNFIYQLDKGRITSDEIVKYLYTSNGVDSESVSIENMKIVGSVVYFTIRLPLEINKGVDMIDTLKILNHCINSFEVEIEEKGHKSTTSYDHLLFHTVDDRGFESLTCFYDTIDGKTEVNEMLLQ